MIDEVSRLRDKGPLALRQLLAEGLPVCFGGRSDFRHVQTPAHPHPGKDCQPQPCLLLIMAGAGSQERVGLRTRLYQV